MKSKSLQCGAIVTLRQHTSYESLEKINLSLRSFETGNMSVDNFKKILDLGLGGSTLEPTVRSGDTGQLSIDHNIDVHVSRDCQIFSDG